jgi:hypothetical protein
MLAVKTGRQSKRWEWLLGICVVVPFACFVLLWLLPKGPRWYVLHPSYALWRYGWHSYNPRTVYEGLSGDIWRQEAVRGKTLPELREMFDQIHEISEFNPYDLSRSHLINAGEGS